MGSTTLRSATALLVCHLALGAARAFGQSADCAAGAGFAGVDCRRLALLTRVAGAAELGARQGTLRRRLEQAGASREQAIAACRQAKRRLARRHLARAARKVGQASATLRARKTRGTIPAVLRLALLGEANALRADLRALRRALRCPADASSVCGDGRRDPGERCDRIEGAPGGPAAEALGDLDLETGSPDAEIAVDANGARVVRTRLEIELAPDATVADANRALDRVDARLVMALEGVPFVLVRIPDPGSLTALDAVVASLEADPAVASVAKAVLDAPDVLGENFTPAPTGAAVRFDTIDHLLAVRAGAAWNARGAVRAGAAPAVVVTDFFGDGPPDAAVAATFPVPFDFATGALDEHGYHVTGILAGSFDGARRCDATALADASSGDAAGRDCVAGMMPAPVTMRAIDVQLGNLSRPAKENKLVQMLRFLGGNVVVNESLGFVGALGDDELRRHAIAWITKVRGGLVRNGTVGAGVEGQVLHVTSAGNRGNASPARINSAPNAAALLPGLTQVAPIPNLTNVLAVENVVNTTASAPGVACLSATSSTGGHVAAPGTSVFSLLSAGAGAAELSGTSQAAPQVAGLAAYVWSLAPDLSPQELAALLRATALRSTTGDPPVGGTCGTVPSAPTIDAYEAVLAVDAAAPSDPTNAPVRLALFDADADGDFDDADLADVAAALIDPATNTPRTQDDPDFGRFDLNGDGFTGEPGFVLGTVETMPFDLDRTGSQQFGAPAFGPALVTQGIEDVPVPFDETAVSDIAVLCFYAYSALYTGDADARRALLDPVTHCFAAAVEAALPATITAEAPESVVVTVGVAGPDGAAAPVAGLVVEVSAQDATVSPGSGTTDADGEMTLVVTAAAEATSVTLDVAVRAVEGGAVIAQTSVSAAVTPSTTTPTTPGGTPTTTPPSPPTTIPPFCTIPCTGGRSCFCTPTECGCFHTF